MKVVTPEISWHERDPIYTVDFQPGKHAVLRMATGGVDKAVRMWQLKMGKAKTEIEFLSNLLRHTHAVNIVRFSPSGEMLASAGDDGVVILWRLSDNTGQGGIFQEEEEDNKEVWTCHKTLRGHLEDIYDLSWSADGRYLISGSVDNSAIMWDVNKQDSKLALLKDHKSFVQGVAWDPLNEYVVTLGTDRSCRVYNIHNKSCVYNVCKMTLPNSEPTTEKPKAFRMFHDDTMRSFFRRLTFTPDGQLLIVPSGCVEREEGIVNATYIFTRGCLNKPAVYLPSPQKATLAVRVCPQMFELRGKAVPKTQDTSNNEDDSKKTASMFSLPYRLVFAVATEDALQLYDTQQTMPIGVISQIHYAQLSDLSWSHNGQVLIVSSTDGFCSIITFDPGELGTPYCPKETSTEEKSATDDLKEEVRESAEILANLKVKDTPEVKESPKVSKPEVKVTTKTKSPGVKVTGKVKSPGVKAGVKDAVKVTPKVKADVTAQNIAKKMGKGDGKKQSPFQAKKVPKKGQSQLVKSPVKSTTEDSRDSDVMIVEEEQSATDKGRQLLTEDSAKPEKTSPPKEKSSTADDKSEIGEDGSSADKRGEEPMDAGDDLKLILETSNDSPCEKSTASQPAPTSGSKVEKKPAAAPDKSRRIQFTTIKRFTQE